MVDILQYMAYDISSNDMECVVFSEAFFSHTRQFVYMF